jgi:hypothetical protein
MAKSQSSANRSNPDETPSGVVRIVDDEGTQWTYSSIHDVPPEHRAKIPEQGVESDMFENPPFRPTNQVVADSMPGVELPDRSEVSPMTWILIGVVLAVILVVAAIFIALSS